MDLEQLPVQEVSLSSNSTKKGRVANKNRRKTPYQLQKCSASNNPTFVSRSQYPNQISETHVSNTTSTLDADIYHVTSTSYLHGLVENDVQVALTSLNPEQRGHQKCVFFQNGEFCAPYDKTDNLESFSGSNTLFDGQSSLTVLEPGNYTSICDAKLNVPLDNQLAMSYVTNCRTASPANNMIESSCFSPMHNDQFNSHHSLNSPNASNTEHNKFCYPYVPISSSAKEANELEQHIVLACPMPFNHWNDFPQKSMHELVNFHGYDPNLHTHVPSSTDDNSLYKREERYLFVTNSSSPNSHKDSEICEFNLCNISTSVSSADNESYFTNIKRNSSDIALKCKPNVEENISRDETVDTNEIEEHYNNKSEETTEINQYNGSMSVSFAESLNNIFEANSTVERAAECNNLKQFSNDVKQSYDERAQLLLPVEAGNNCNDSNNSITSDVQQSLSVSRSVLYNCDVLYTTNSLSHISSGISTKSIYTNSIYAAHDSDNTANLSQTNIEKTTIMTQNASSKYLTLLNEHQKTIYSESPTNASSDSLSSMSVGCVPESSYLDESGAFLINNESQYL